MKHTYLITSEQKAPLAEFIEAGRDFLGAAPVEFTDMTFVTTEDDALAGVLDLVIRRDAMLGFLASAIISPTSEEEGRAVEYQAQPGSNGHKESGACLACGGPTISKRTRWCSKPECRKAQKAGWKHPSEPPAIEETQKEPVMVGARQDHPFGRQSLLDQQQ